jgi:hypothetical protein
MASTWSWCGPSRRKPIAEAVTDDGAFAGHLVQVRLHLTFCPMCRRTYRALQTNRDSLAALRELDVQDTEVSSKSTNPNDNSGR